MRKGAPLIIIGTIAGSLFMAVFLWKISANLVPESIRDSQVSGGKYPQGGNSANENKDEVGINKDTSSEDVTAECAVSQQYPRKVQRWCSLITHYANQRNLSPDLVAAVILLESGGNPDAYSNSGAVGLMQVMPRDGLAASFLCANGPCFNDRPSKSKLLNPEFNLKYGTRMLARLHKNHGNLREALRYYGPMDVGYAYADKVLAIYDTHRQ